MPGMPARPPPATLSGMHKLTATETGWIKAVEPGPSCFSCKEPGRLYQPLSTGAMVGNIQMLWWCQACDVTWVK